MTDRELSEKLAHARATADLAIAGMEEHMLEVRGLAVDVAEAMTNITAWGAVVSILEGGLLQGEHTQKAEAQVIKIAKAQMLLEVRKHDAALRRLKGLP